MVAQGPRGSRCSSTAAEEPESSPRAGDSGGGGEWRCHRTGGPGHTGRTQGTRENQRGHCSKDMGAALGAPLGSGAWTRAICLLWQIPPSPPSTPHFRVSPKCTSRARGDVIPTSSSRSPGAPSPEEVRKPRDSCRTGRRNKTVQMFNRKNLRGASYHREGPDAVYILPRTVSSPLTTGQRRAADTTESLHLQHSTLGPLGPCPGHHQTGLRGPCAHRPAPGQDAPKPTHSWKRLRWASTAPCRFVLKRERSAVAHQALEESLSREKETMRNTGGKRNSPEERDESGGRLFNLKIQTPRRSLREDARARRELIAGCPRPTEPGSPSGITRDKPHPFFPRLPSRPPHLF